MTTPSGQISLSDVRLEIYGSSTGQISMTDSLVYKLAGLTPGSAISMSNLKSKTWLKLTNISASSSTSPVTGSAIGWMNGTGTVNITKTAGFSTAFLVNGSSVLSLTSAQTTGSITVAAGDTLEIDATAVINNSAGGEVTGTITLSGAMGVSISVDLIRTGSGV